MGQSADGTILVSVIAMPNTEFIIDELTALLEEGNAHVSFEKAVKGLPPHLLSKVPETRFFLMSGTCFTFVRVTSCPDVIFKITLPRPSILETAVFPILSFSSVLLF